MEINQPLLTIINHYINHYMNHYINQYEPHLNYIFSGNPHIPQTNRSRHGSTAVANPQKGGGRRLRRGQAGGGDLTKLRKIHGRTRENQGN